jgi:hypothetical protein
VTCRVNIRRGEPANRTVCRNGHSLADCAFQTVNGGKYRVRRCRQCMRDTANRYVARNRDTINAKKRLSRAAA